MCEKIQRSPMNYVGPETENFILFIRDNLKRNANHKLLIDSNSGISWTGRQLQYSIEVVATFLIENFDLKKGDICAIDRQEDALSAVLMLGIIATGCTCILGDYYRPFIGFVNYNRPKLIFASTADLHKIIDHFKGSDKNFLSSLKMVSVDHAPADSDSIKMLPDIFDENQLAERMSLDKISNLIQIEPDKDVALLQLTTGTTGNPKRSARTHRNLCHIAVSKDHTELIALKPNFILGGSTLNFRPGLWCLLACIRFGATYVYAPFKDVESFLRHVETFRINLFFLSVYNMQKLRDVQDSAIDRFDLTSLQHMIASGSRILDREVPQILVKKLKLKTFRQGFGMSEAGGASLIHLSETDEKHQSIGRPLLGVELAILNRETGEFLGPNERGELLVRSPQVAIGYVTEEPGVLSRAEWTEDNFLMTGDEAYYDSKGLFYITGRYKEMLLTGVWKLFPDYIEQEMLKYPSIDEVCVVSLGKLDGLYCEIDIVGACVILRPNCNTTKEEIIAHLADKIPYLKLRGGLMFVERFPFTGTGKVDKQTLRQYLSSHCDDLIKNKYNFETSQPPAVIQS